MGLIKMKERNLPECIELNPGELGEKQQHYLFKLGSTALFLVNFMQENNFVFSMFLLRKGKVNFPVLL